MRLWELPSGTLLSTFQTAEVADSYVVGLAFTPDGGALVSVTQWEGIVQVWDVDALTVRRTFRIPTVTYFTLTPGGRQLAADYAKPGFELWEPATGSRLGNHPDIIGAGGPGYTAFSAHSRRVAVWGYVSELGRTLAVWDVPNNRQLTAMALDNRAGATNDWLSAAFSPDGTRLAASDAAGHIYLYEHNQLDRGDALGRAALGGAAVMGRRGEGYVVVQFILLGLIALAPLVGLGGAWPAPVGLAARVVGGLLIVVGGALALAGLLHLGVDN